MAATVQLTDLRLDVLHVLLSTERRLAHDALRLGAGWGPQEGVLAGAAGVNGQHVAARLWLVHPGDVVGRAVFTEELGQTGSGSVRGTQEEAMRAIDSFEINTSVKKTALKKDFPVKCHHHCISFHQKY